MKREWLVLFACLIAGVGLSTARAQVHMDGYVHYGEDGSRMRISIPKIINDSAVRSEKLRLRMWASEHDWEPEHKGRLVTFSPLPRLKPFGKRYDVDVSRPMHRPPRGSYYMAVTLEERTVDANGSVQWVIRDWVTSDYKYYFSEDAPFKL